jgi:hypothetical protein
MSDLLTLGPVAALPIVLNLLGKMLSASPINNRWIPMILSAIGAAAGPLVLRASDLNVPSPEIMGVLLGFYLGAGATGQHQLVRQLFGQKEETETPPKP